MLCAWLISLLLGEVELLPVGVLPVLVDPLGLVLLPVEPVPLMPVVPDALPVELDPPVAVLPVPPPMVVELLPDGLVEVLPPGLVELAVCPDVPLLVLPVVLPLPDAFALVSPLVLLPDLIDFDELSSPCCDAWAAPVAERC